MKPLKVLTSSRSERGIACVHVQYIVVACTLSQHCSTVVLVVVLLNVHTATACRTDCTLVFVMLLFLQLLLLLLLLQVTIVTQGTNHGWPQFEGSLYNKQNFCGNNPPPGSYTPPTFEVRTYSMIILIIISTYSVVE
jgi:hypothetical protein